MMRMPAGRGDVGGGGAWGQWPWRPWRELLLLSRLGQEAREWESEGKESEATRRRGGEAGAGGRGKARRQWRSGAVAMAGALLLLSRLGQDARERESEGKESEAMRRAPAAAGWLRLGGRRMGQDGENGNRHVGPTATWTPRQRNRRPKPSDGQSRTVLIVGWPKIPGFAIRWPKPNRDQS